MTPTLFPDLPNEASLWIYAANRSFSEDEKTALIEGLEPFLAQWTTHGHPVLGDAAIAHDRFLLVAGIVPDGELSGCGIDASIQAVKMLFNRLSLDFVPGLDVLYRATDGAVRNVSRPEFRALVQSGAVTAATPVFDLSLTTVGALRQGGLEKPAGRSWHAKVFRIPELVS